jgi:hypothetical protein
VDVVCHAEGVTCSALVEKTDFETVRRSQVAGRHRVRRESRCWKTLELMAHWERLPTVEATLAVALAAAGEVDGSSAVATSRVLAAGPRVGW